MSSLHRDEDTMADNARSAIRDVERFAYRIVSESDQHSEYEARTILRLAIGLRRKLDRWTPKEE